jgi:splicing factor 3B subunit 3
MIILDYSTVAGSDKFGNFFISRLPKEINDEIEDESSTGFLKFKL